MNSRYILGEDDDDPIVSEDTRLMELRKQLQEQEQEVRKT
jgi:hypothetical protein